MESRFTVGLLVANKVGVLYRVAGLFAKRNYNIESIAVGETENPDYSRMTIVSTGDEYIREQVLKQLNKLYDVKKVTLLHDDDSITREHALIKLNVDNSTSKKVTELMNQYGGKVMDLFNDSITIEITENSDMIDKFIEDVKDIGILEVCRSGSISLSQGSRNLFTVKDLL